MLFIYSCCYYKAVVTLFQQVGSKSQIFLQDPRSENRKSAVLELKGMLVKI